MVLLSAWGPDRHARTDRLAVTVLLRPLVERPSDPDALVSLMARVREGDDAAFRDLYDLTVPRVTRVVSATTRSPEHAAEVVQEVFLYAWQHTGSYDPARGSVVGWLGMIAHRRAVDRVRSVVRADVRDRRSSLTNDAAAPDTADLGIARHEAFQLRGQLDHLTLAQRQAVVATYLDGYTHQEAARLLSIPVGTLKSRIRAGLAVLRARLDPFALEAPSVVGISPTA